MQHGVRHILFALLILCWGGVTMAGPDTEKLFAEAPPDVRDVAGMIEDGAEVDTARLNGLPLDERYGQGITLLFHALSCGNVEAAASLIRAGADVRLVDRPSEGSTRDLLYFLTLPGGDEIDRDGLDLLLRTWLEMGGDPNARLQGPEQPTLATQMALMGNETALSILLDAGADPWIYTTRKGERSPNNVMTTLVGGSAKEYDTIDALIDRGAFDARRQDEIETFLMWLGGYAQRGDETSLEIKRIAMRVLKRNPDYRPPDDGRGTQRIFKEHYSDPGQGEIPWELIRSDDVK